MLLLVWPLFDGIWISLQEFDMFDGTGAYAGLANYKRLFADKIFLGAVWNTALFVLMTVPAFVVVGLVLALALNRPTRRRRRAARHLLRHLGAVGHHRHHRLEHGVPAGPRPADQCPRRCSARRRSRS